VYTQHTLSSYYIMCTLCFTPNSFVMCIDNPELDAQVPATDSHLEEKGRHT